jgi:hypothetical protein
VQKEGLPALTKRKYSHVILSAHEKTSRVYFGCGFEVIAVIKELESILNH